MIGAVALILGLAVVPVVDAADPRLALLQLQLDDRHHEALRQTRQLRLEDPQRARDLGLPFLEAELLKRLGRHSQAADLFADFMGAGTPLAAHSRYRLALEYEKMGHPEVAAGLVASLVEPGVDPWLLSHAARLLARSLARGGNCGLVTHKDPDRLPRTASRHLRLAQGECALRTGTPEGRARAHRLFQGILEEDVRDEPQLSAAEALSAHPPASVVIDPRAPHLSLHALLGLAFYQHRRFGQAIEHLEKVVSAASGPLSQEEYELGYARARSLFWQGRFAVAAQRFGWLAVKGPRGEHHADALYQQGRCFELGGRPRHAFASFRAAYRADPDGSWAAASLFSMIRLAWLDQRQEEALKLFEHLAGDRRWRSMAARAALFLAASDLVQGRADRAGPWLTLAHRAPAYRLEVEYWRGRRAELEGRPGEALGHYLTVLQENVFHPLAEGARRRLAGPALAELAEERGRRAATLDDPRILYQAWLLLGSGDADGRAALERLEERLLQDRSVAPFLELSPLPPRQWPLWQEDFQDPHHALLALGTVDLVAHEAHQTFPLSDLRLGLTGSRMLADLGEVRHSIRMAEALFQQVPQRFPEPLLPDHFRRLLHPLAHRDLLFEAGRRFGIDPLLLAAIIREESRFDPRALSAASARGLTQFILPTANWLAPRVGLRSGAVQAEDLYRPPVSVALGAAYLEELGRRFEDTPEMTVAAYNAGESQAELWRSYCFSGELEEYFTKVSFRETRNYLARVLGSYARYLDLYPPLEPEPRGQRTASP